LDAERTPIAVGQMCEAMLLDETVASDQVVS